MTSDWHNRIVGYDPAVDPSQLCAHPRNHRRHPQRQADAMRAALGEIGWTDVVKVNVRSGYVLDGHLRVEEALSRDATVPVLYVDLDERDEAKALATHDAITGLAVVDVDMLSALAVDADIQSADLQAVVDDLITPKKHGGNDEPDEPQLTWGFLGWGKARRVDVTADDVALLDAEVERWAQAGSPTGFLAWLRREGSDGTP